MGLKVTNNAFGTLNAGINSTDTVIVLEAGQGARFPVLSAGDYFYATLIDTSNQLEIVKVTARATDTMTVVRTQDGTSSRAYNVNDRFELRPTAALFNEIIESIENIPPATPTQVSDQANTSTGSFSIPVGTTAQRPASPASGMIRQNSTTGEPEWYDAVSGQWLTFSQSKNYQVEYLVIAGGAGGSGFGGGGGGAGGYRSSVGGQSSGGGASAESPLILTTGTAYTVTIGAGGAGGVSATWIGGQGNNSVFGAVTSFGGGYGGFDGLLNGVSGGSGGGAGTSAATGGVGGAGTSGQGFAGGNQGGQFEKAAGGGGAGAVGVNGTTNSRAGDGGTGVSSVISGSSITRAGGGGGACRVSAGQVGGNGGTGGGGRGADSSSNNCTAGSANTGGGGGGGRGFTAQDPGAAGGSGIVIIRYLGPQRGTGGTVTSSGGFTIHTFTSSGTFTA